MPPVDEKPFESLNVIPFVDIMLVLLTMVLTTASFIAVGRIPLALPQASPMKVEQQAETIIEIDASGTIHLDGAALDLPALRERLGPLPKDTALLIRADRTLPFQRFVDVADLLKQLAFAKVGIQTQGVASSTRPGAAP
ncbi:ExbD/TolR family protein [Xanthobacter sediminis]|uniref:ExbD/TolR family protein n=1 Tax=Xanthobacter sediminis TaxID=3119926 RepID=UPI00372D858A